MSTETPEYVGGDDPMQTVKNAEQTYAASQQKIKDARQKNKAALEYRASIEKKFKELEEKIKSVTAKDQSASEEPPAEESKEEPKKEVANSTPFEGKSDAIYTLFVISYMLIRLSNQKELAESTEIKLRNYFKYFVKLIEIYEYLLIIGHTMNYPGGSEGQESKDPESKDPEPKDPEPKDPEPKDPEPKDPEPKDQGSKDQKSLKEDPTFLRELRAFHAYLFMSVSSNNSVKQMLTNPSSDSFKTDQKWLSNLTSKENTILTSKEFLNIQDKLFENLVSSFMILFAKFEVVANLRGDILEGKKADLTTLNEHVAKFNSLETQSGETEANAQVDVLEKIMKEGPVPIKDPMVIADKAVSLAEDADKIQSDITSQVDPDKSMIKKVYDAVAALFKRKSSTPKSTESKPSAPKSTESKPSAPKSTESKPSAPTPVESKPSTPPPVESKPSTPTPVELKPSAPPNPIQYQGMNPPPPLYIAPSGYPPVYPGAQGYPPVYPNINRPSPPLYIAPPGYPPVYPGAPGYPPVYPNLNRPPPPVYPGAPGYPPVYPNLNRPPPPVYPGAQGYPPVYQNPGQYPVNMPSAPQFTGLKPFNAPYPGQAPPVVTMVGGHLRRSRRINKSNSHKKTLRRSKNK